MLELDIMSTYSEGYFNPYRKLTRGDAALLIYNFDAYTETSEYIIYITMSESTGVPLLDTLQDVYNRVAENYYGGGLNTDELLYTAISEMVDSIGDKYTVFSQPQATETFTETLEGQYEGIGIYITQEDDGSIIVTNFLANSPAEEAGLKANDIIIKVDGEEVSGIDLNEAADLIKGDTGTTVDLLIQRSVDDSIELLEFTVERRELAVTYLEAEVLDNNIAYYKLTFFGDQTDEEFTMKTEEFISEYGTLNGIILDLRNNPGGYVNTATDILSHFIPENEVITTIRYNDGDVTYLSGGPADLQIYPL
ncbi:MAG: hypothetical protein ACD_65C00276G0001, partial [uncultured bacterium]